MVASETWVALASGAIGAGGAILAQLVAAVTSGRADKRRREHEESQQKSVRFLDIKRELYSAFLLQAEKAVNASSFSTGSLDELRRIHSNIWLIAPPEVTVTVRKAIDDIAAAQEDYSLPEHTIKARGKVRMGARMAIESARNALSADLTGYNWPERKSKTRARLVFWKKGN